jgi:hypothetical protein
MTKSEIHESWWNGDRDKPSCCEGVGVGYEYQKRIADLEKENAELKCECRRCVYTDSPCILSDYGKDRNGICAHFKDVFDENAELNDELKKWKDEWQEQVQKATDEGYARTLQTMQLTKAKELLKQWLSLCGFKVEKLVKDTEQFLNSEVEK